METGGSATLTGTKRDREKVQTLRQKRQAATIRVTHKDGKIIFSYVELDEHVEIHPDSWNAAQKLGFCLDKTFQNSYGYPAQNIGNTYVKVHILLMADSKEAAVSHWKAQGAPEHAWKDMVVCHLNDCPLDFNLSNLLIAPSAVNRALCKGGCAQKMKNLQGVLWRCTLRVGGNQVNTKCLGTPDEAQHARDILKISLLPQYMRSIIFKYGLVRPAPFAAFYHSINTLLERAQIYEKETRAVCKAKALTTRFHISNFGSNFLPELFFMEDVEPFDPLLDLAVTYQGSGGCTIDFLIEKPCFEKFTQDYQGNFGLDSAGYLCIGSDKLHIQVCNRKRGSHTSDKLVVRHAVGGVIGRRDIRKRTLRIGTQSENMQDIGKGYCEKGNKFQCRVRNKEKRYRLGSFKTEDDAKFVTKFRRDNWRMLMKEVEEFKENNQQVGAHLRARCAEALAKNVTSV